jgi:uncharacterized membrane-anchored protein YhcB (DUF1043 family)
MTGKNPSRSMDDIDEIVLNYAEVKAIATGNPMIRRKMELDLELNRLQVLESQYRADRYSLEDKVVKTLPVKINNTQKRITAMSADIQRRDKHIGEEFFMAIGTNTFTERKDAGELLLKALLSNQYKDKTIGSYKDFSIIAQAKSMITDTCSVLIKGDSTHMVELSNDNVGCVMRIENAVKTLENRLSESQRELESLETQLSSAKEQLKRHFEHEAAMNDIMSELSKVNANLDVNKNDEANLVLPEENEDILGLSTDAAREDEEEIEYEG